ncbi:MAG: GTP-dependent dephospho-CoA kinase family protein [Candidatus Micrarchaeota archaeon]|nr:GTP-dependent dephospho-CoA kinase family protein [Candidatus Micrarchaeota archaeon]
MKHATPELRVILSKPQGKLLTGQEAARFLGKKRAARKAPFIAAVGDATACLLLRKRIIPDLAVYDLRKLREPVTAGEKKLLESFPARKSTAANPSGTLTPALFSALKKIFSAAARGKARAQRAPAKLFIKGEEDLAVIPVVLLAPPGAFVAYGQPHQGVVMIHANAAAKRKMKRIYAAFASRP